MSNLKFAAKNAESVLFRLDKMAAAIEANHEAWGMPFDTAKAIVNDIDTVADAIEQSSFGTESLERRQEEVVRQAKVIQKDSDESYMNTFANPMAPHQVESDEAYMNAYRDDQTSAVRDGKATNGRPLT